MADKGFIDNSERIGYLLEAIDSKTATIGEMLEAATLNAQRLGPDDAGKGTLKAITNIRNKFKTAIPKAMKKMKLEEVFNLDTPYSKIASVSGAGTLADVARETKAVGQTTLKNFQPFQKMVDGFFNIYSEEASYGDRKWFRPGGYGETIQYKKIAGEGGLFRSADVATKMTKITKGGKEIIVEIGSQARDSDIFPDLPHPRVLTQNLVEGVGYITDLETRNAVIFNLLIPFRPGEIAMGTGTGAPESVLRVRDFNPSTGILRGSKRDKKTRNQLSLLDEDFFAEGHEAGIGRNSQPDVNASRKSLAYYILEEQVERATKRAEEAAAAQGIGEIVEDSEGNRKWKALNPGDDLKLEGIVEKQPLFDTTVTKMSDSLGATKTTWPIDPDTNAKERPLAKSLTGILGQHKDTLMGRYLKGSMDLRKIVGTALAYHLQKQGKIAAETVEVLFGHQEPHKLISSMGEIAKTYYVGRQQGYGDASRMAIFINEEMLARQLGAGSVHELASKLGATAPNIDPNILIDQNPELGSRKVIETSPEEKAAQKAAAERRAADDLKAAEQSTHETLELKEKNRQLQLQQSQIPIEERVLAGTGKLVQQTTDRLIKNQGSVSSEQVSVLEKMQKGEPLTDSEKVLVGMAQETVDPVTDFNKTFNNMTESLGLDIEAIDAIQNDPNLSNDEKAAKIAKVVNFSYTAPSIEPLPEVAAAQAQDPFKLSTTVAGQTAETVSPTSQVTNIDIPDDLIIHPEDSPEVQESKWQKLKRVTKKYGGKIVGHPGFKRTVALLPWVGAAAGMYDVRQVRAAEKAEYEARGEEYPAYMEAIRGLQVIEEAVSPFPTTRDVEVGAELVGEQFKLDPEGGLATFGGVPVGSPWQTWASGESGMHKFAEGLKESKQDTANPEGFAQSLEGDELADVDGIPEITPSTSYDQDLISEYEGFIPNSRY